MGRKGSEEHHAPMELSRSGICHWLLDINRWLTMQLTTNDALSLRVGKVRCLTPFNPF